MVRRVWWIACLGAALCLAGCSSGGGQVVGVADADDAADTSGADGPSDPDTPTDGATAADLDAAPDAPAPDVADAAADAADVDDGDCPPLEDVYEPPNLLQLGNGVESCDNVLLKPDPGEEGAWCLARLTPPAWPFYVTAVRYRLGHGEAGDVMCDARLEHQVELFTAPDPAPSAEPSVSLELNVPALPEDTEFFEGRSVVIELEEPFEVAENHHLFAALQLNGTHPDVMCAYVDGDSPSEADRNYWSSATAKPWDWVQLASFGLNGSVLIYAYGYTE